MLVSGSQEQWLYLNAFQLFARCTCIYISQVVPQKRFTSTAGCKILFKWDQALTGLFQSKEVRSRTRTLFVSEGVVGLSLSEEGVVGLSLSEGVVGLSLSEGVVGLSLSQAVVGLSLSEE